MKVSILDSCTACGLCCDICPEVFEMGDDIAQVIADDIEESLTTEVEQAAEDCPSGAIILDDDVD
jgi:ferredoxin